MTDQSPRSTYGWDSSVAGYPAHPPLDDKLDTRSTLTFDPHADRAARLARLTQRRAGGQELPPPGGRVAPRRRHPSKRSRVAALGLSLATTGGLTYAFASSADAGATSAALPGAAVSTADSATTLTTTSPSTSSSSAATAPSTTTGSATGRTPTTTAPTTTAPTTSASATGTTTVNGAAFTNRFGTVQVQAVFGADGKLTAVNVLQLPTDRKSVAINNRAVPTLNSEALTTQSAKVHTVSGATYTSQDYAKSLQSAIDTARAKGITKLA